MHKFEPFLHLRFSFAFIADKMFNQLQFPTDINMIIVVAFGVGVDAIVIGNYSSVFIIKIMNLKEGFQKVKFVQSIF